MRTDLFYKTQQFVFDKKMVYYKAMSAKNHCQKYSGEVLRSPE